ncbi:MAG TPA: fumarylacetoacetate hydrolase family protein [Acidimicrobiales bacterium]|jgi:2-keto-4-pentenoate hydratase/2-oxohepta-3-ene-1,7-dioic acid hydratase in catechol pathway|nr:fumarylacetoacetate hydrolase family protein [Acidimicrobiales bacterium]
MRFANLGGRMQLLVSGGTIDVAQASGDKLPSDPQACLEVWDDLVGWAGGASAADATVQSGALLAPVPRPRQVVGIALNYQLHVGESNFSAPEEPSAFTKFPSCIAGPGSDIPIASGTVDWEVELVAVMGRTAHHIPEGRGWDYVAALTVGQDISDRAVQLRPPAPQFSLGKSFPAFGPIGPELVTVDEFDDPDDLAIDCSVNGRQVQRARTSELIFSVPELVSRLSAIITLYPGDLIFTGTPAGVGHARTPPVYLRPGDQLASTIEGIGTLHNNCVAP